MLVARWGWRSVVEGREWSMRAIAVAEVLSLQTLA